jgi:hypothetical protein
MLHAQAKVFAAPHRTILNSLSFVYSGCILHWSMVILSMFTCIQVEIQLRGTTREPIGNESLVDISPIYVITYFLPDVFTFMACEMVMTTSHQRSILKIQKSVEFLIYTYLEVFYFDHIFEFYLVTRVFL